MSDHIQQQHPGQTFHKAIAGFLRGNLLVSGYEPRTGSLDRFWWGILENTDGTKTVACGRVSNFQDYGWGYKIEEASAWEHISNRNPPLNVRNALVKHGLRVKGVFEPGITEHEFTTTLLQDLTSNLLTSLRAGDEKYALDAIASLQSTVVHVIAAFIRGGVKVTFPESVMDACTDHLDAESASVFARYHRFKTITLTFAQAAKVAPFLNRFDFDNLQSTFPS